MQQVSGDNDIVFGPGRETPEMVEVLRVISLHGNSGVKPGSISKVRNLLTKPPFYVLSARDAWVNHILRKAFINDIMCGFNQLRIDLHFTPGSGFQPAQS